MIIALSILCGLAVLLVVYALTDAPTPAQPPYTPRHLGGH